MLAGQVDICMVWMESVFISGSVLGVIDLEGTHVYLSLPVLLILWQKCSYIETAKHEGERKKERGWIFHSSVIEGWRHQPRPKEICPASVLIKHIYNSVLYICNLTIELVPFNWQQMVCDYCLPRRKRKKSLSILVKYGLSQGLLKLLAFSLVQFIQLEFGN